MKAWNIVAFLLRIAIAVYTVLQIAGQLNYYSMGISYGLWAELNLPVSLFWVNVILLCESLGALFLALGLFDRAGAFILFMTYNALILLTSATLYQFWTAAFACLLLFILGNGRF